MQLATSSWSARSGPSAPELEARRQHEGRQLDDVAARALGAEAEDEGDGPWADVCEERAGSKPNVECLDIARSGWGRGGWCREANKFMDGSSDNALSIAGGAGLVWVDGLCA